MDRERDPRVERNRNGKRFPGRAVVPVLPVLTASLLFASSALPGKSSAAFRPFVYGSGQSIRISTETENDLLDKITLHDRVKTWQAGAGLRIFPGSGRLDAAERSRWEFRFRYGRGAGDLPDKTYQVEHTGPRNPYSYSVSDKYDQSYSIWGVSFLTRLLPQVAAYIGPAVQSVTYKATRSVAGKFPDPRYGLNPKPGKDKEVVRYGLLELGVQLTPRKGYPALDVSWAPSRFNLSTTRRTNSNSFQGEFPDMNASIGVGLVYDFSW